MKIQKPTLGRVVLYTAFRGHEEKDTDVYTALVTRVTNVKGGIAETFVDLVTFGSSSVYFQTSVPYDSDGAAKTWRYPPKTDEMIEID